MTLPQLRELAEKAKAWRPLHWCSFNETAWRGDCGEGSKIAEDESCPECLGARRAVEDIASAVDVAMSRITSPPEKGRHWVDELPPDHFARIASRIASYFGDPGPVAAFEAAVREMCNG